MDILAQLETAKTELATANALVADANAAVEAANAQVATLQAEAVTKDAALVAANEAVTAKENERLAAVAEYETAKARIAELEATQKSADEKAVEIVAAQGIKPTKVDATEGSETSKAALLEQFSAMTNHAERSAFWAKHKATLLGK